MKKQKTSVARWSREWGVGVRVWVERHGKNVIDERTADLLVALDRTKSISGAARSMGISYRHAWLLLQQANEHSGELLVATAIGGQRGGGAELTEWGRTALTVFQQIQQRVRREAARTIPRIVASMADDSRVLHLAAAISLQELVALVLGEYALAQPTVTVRSIFGASNELADQIAAGSPADVFIAADGSPLQRLAKGGFLTRGSRRKLAANTLAIVGDPALAGTIRRVSDLRRFSSDRIAVADPACPLGVSTSAFLRSAGLWEALRPRLRFAENSRAVVTSVRGGECRLGIIFGSDILNAVGAATLLQIAPSSAGTVYEGAAIATSSNSRAASDLLDFFASEKAQRCWRRCGFAVSKLRGERHATAERVKGIEPS